VAVTAEALEVPKKPPFTLKLSGLGVPCGMLSGEGPITPGRTLVTTIWHSGLQCWGEPFNCEAVITRNPEGGGDANLSAVIRTRNIVLETSKTSAGATAVPLMKTRSVEMKFVPVMKAS
jgi:hypothetical protein